MLAFNKNRSAGAGDAQDGTAAVDRPFGDHLPAFTLTDIPGKSDTILRILPANSFCARIVTPKLDGMITVMSPLPVDRKESDMGLPASRLAMMLPMAVETRTLPEMLSRFTPPPAFSQRTPSAEPTFTGPPELRAVTMPCAWPTSIGAAARGGNHRGAGVVDHECFPPW